MLRLTLILFFSLASFFAQAQSKLSPLQPQEFRVTLLGTGSPTPSMTRFGPGVLIQAGGKNLLIDSGRGTTQRIWQLGIKLGSIDAVFITHLHSDHVVGLPDLWLTGWLETNYAQRNGPFVVYGPKGTQQLMNGLEQAYEWDIKARIADQALKPENIKSVVTEVNAGVVYKKDGLTVTAIEVDHGDLLKPAFGYRIDYENRSVTISGDTRYSENLVKNAMGSNLIIHQVAAAKEALLKNPAIKVILDHHTSPEEAGTLFSKVKPQLAVFYHFVLLAGPGIPAVTEKEVLDMARKTYSGPLLIGEDLMSFQIEKDQVIQK